MLTQILKDVHTQYINNYGEITSFRRFEANEKVKMDDSLPNFIDVLFWASNEQEDMNVFCTIGMSDKEMNGADFRSELRFLIRGELTDDEIIKISSFLINLSYYPFSRKKQFNWFHLFSNPGKIPCFDTTKSVVFFPAFVKGGFDRLESEEKEVKILNVIPITESERAIMREKKFMALSEHFSDINIDLFTRR